MNCELTQIDRYLEDDLEPAERAETEAHLSECIPCEVLHRQLAAESFLYRERFSRIRPSSDLWGGIARIVQEEPKHTGRFGRYVSDALRGARRPQIAAVLILLIALGVGALLMSDLRPHDPPHRALSRLAPTSSYAEHPVERPAESGAVPRSAVPKRAELRSNAPPPSAPRQASEKRERRAARAPESADQAWGEAVADMDRQYSTSIALLMRDLTGEHRNKLIGMEQPLGQIDKTIAETREAARRQPADVFAVQYMRTAYERKIDVLRAVAQQ
jgi:hypothetical protein